MARICMYADVRCDVYVKPANTCPQWAAAYCGERDRCAGDGMTSNCHVCGPMDRWISPFCWFLAVLSALNRRAMSGDGALQNAIQDGIGDGRITNPGMPKINRKLAGNKHGPVSLKPAQVLR